MKVEDVKRPLIKGEKLLVPCLIRKEVVMNNEEQLWLDLTNRTAKFRIYIYYL